MVSRFFFLDEVQHRPLSCAYRFLFVYNVCKPRYPGGRFNLGFGLCILADILSRTFFVSVLPVLHFCRIDRGPWTKILGVMSHVD
jgi:hypothetical protein